MPTSLFSKGFIIHTGKLIMFSLSVISSVSVTQFHYEGPSPSAFLMRVSQLGLKLHSERCQPSWISTFLITLLLCLTHQTSQECLPVLVPFSPLERLSTVLSLCERRHQKHFIQVKIFSETFKYNSPHPLILRVGGCVPRPKWMPEIMNSSEPYLYCCGFFSFPYLPTFSLKGNASQLLVGFSVLPASPLLLVEAIIKIMVTWHKYSITWQSIWWLRRLLSD